MRKANSDALRLSLATGLRISDVLSLRPSQAVYEGDKWYIRTIAQKTGKAVRAPVPEALARILTRREKYAWVFPSARNPQKHRTRQAVWSDIKRTCKLLGISGNITPHSARKIFAVTEFKRHGLDTVREELQHDHITTTMIYAFSDILSAEKGKKANNEPKDTKYNKIVDKFVENLEKELGGFERLRRAVRACLINTFCTLEGREG